MPNYAGGKYAIAICDRCGFQFPYLSLVREPVTALYVCRGCLDEPNPLRWLRARSDGVAIMHPRVDVPLAGAPMTTNLLPTQDALYDLGASEYRWRDLWLSRTARIPQAMLGTLSTTGAATLGTTLDVTGAATFQSTLSVTGAATFASTLAVTSTVTFSAGLTVGGAATLASLSCTGAATLGSVTMNGDIDLNGNDLILDADGDSYIRASTDDTVVIGTGNSDRVVVDSSGNALFGQATNGFGYRVAVANSAIVQRATNDAIGALLDLTKTRSTAPAGQTVVQAGDVLGYLTWRGSDGTQYVTAAQITGEVGGTPGTNDMPGRLVFRVTADGASSPTEAMRITPARDVGINETSPDYKLHVNGPIGFAPGVSVTPANNLDVVFELTNNTTLTVKAKGGDGTVRSGTIALS